MGSFLVVYGTGEGQTAKVADRVVTVLSERGHDVSAAEAADRPSTAALADVDAVLVGASIHVGTHQPEVSAFVREHSGVLARLPTAFFQVSMSSAASDDDRRAQAAAYVDEFLEATDWNPDRIGLFGGALRYSKYGFLKRLMMKRIAGEATGDTDTSRDYEYTDWHEVEAFTADFAGFVERRLGVPPADSVGERNTE